MIQMRFFTKCTLSLALLLLVAFTSNAQNNPIESYRFNPDFTPRDSSYYTYNGQGKLTEKHTVSYNANTTTWSNSSKETYLIDGQGNVLSKLTLTWKNNAWEESFKTTNTYSNNKLTVAVIETKTSAGWVKLNQLEYSYTQDGKTDSINSYKFDNAGLKENSTRTKYIYATSGKIAERVIERWKASSSTWDVTAKWVYLYDFSDRLIKEEEDNFIGGQWFHIHHFKYNYSSDDKLRIKEHINSATSQPIDNEGYKYEGEDAFLPVNTVVKENSVKLYPNPFSHTATLSWDAKGTYTVTVKDMSGKVLQNIETVTDNKVRIDGTHFKQGVYFYTLKNVDNGKQTIGRFVITH